MEYHSTWKIIETEGRKRILTEKLEIDIIELPKIEAKQEIAKKLKDEGISIGKIEQITGLTEEEIKPF